MSNDCNDPMWPAVPPDETDDDGDGFSVCAGDCDDASGATHPGAPQVCDGVNDDCDDPDWPEVPADEVDVDGDGYRVCAGDCDDADAAVHPASAEVCNGVDDDCKGLTDDDLEGEDTDGDGVHNPCDNCRAASNPTQTDTDGDGFGDACDNCPVGRNPTQADLDGDSESDRCDADDGVLLIVFDSAVRVDWDPEAGLEIWNCYRGDLGVLRSTGAYTQAPGSNPLADRACGLDATFMDDPYVPPPSQIAFYLATGMADGLETGLGFDGSGGERPNAAACW